VIGLVVLLFAAVGLARRARTRWPFVTVLLYGVFFVLLVLPFLWGVFVLVGDGDAGVDSWTELPHIYAWLYGDTCAWPYWLLFAGLILAQICLLSIPVQTGRERPKPRRGIWQTAIAAGFLYSVLLFGVVVSLLSAVTGDEWPTGSDWLLWIALPANWILWVVVFKRFANGLDPQSYSRRIVKWLMRGSILELLVAVPSHIIVRHKDVCCAHMATAAGIAAGLAVMFLAFGPGLYYLYIDRINGKKPGSSKTSDEQQLSPETCDKSHSV
jgi:hypothetical protein